MAKTKVKQCAFALTVFDFHIGMPGFVYVGAILAQ